MYLWHQSGGQEMRVHLQGQRHGLLLLHGAACTCKVHMTQISPHKVQPHTPADYNTLLHLYSSPTGSAPRFACDSIRFLTGLGMAHSWGPAGGCCTCLHWCDLCIALPRQGIRSFPESRDGRPSCIPSLPLHHPLAQTISSCPSSCARDAQAAFPAQLVQTRFPGHKMLDTS